MRVGPEAPRSVVHQGGAQVGGDLLQLVEAGQQGLAHQALVRGPGQRHLGAQGGRPVHQHQQQAVLVERMGLLQGGVAVPQALGEGVGVAPREVRVDPATRQHRPEREAGRGDVAQRDVELLLVEVALLGGLGLERRAFQLEGGHQGALTGLGEGVGEVRLQRHQGCRQTFLVMELQCLHGR